MVCRAEFRLLKALHPPYADTVEFLAISTDPFDDGEAIRRYRDGNEYPWMMAPTDLEMIKEYGVRVQATKFGIDGDGIIVYKRGYGTGSEADWVQVLEQLANTGQ